ncbi:MAG: alpha/beta fold hydrolase [Thermoflexaceae bacterium]|nr:alpha/beta fold hydrolase [Thermoflexaceae bacterium]
MAYIDRDGVKIYYEDHGQGPAILLTHGFADTSIFWRGQVAAFSDRYRVITWDMRGHGQSDSPDDPALYSEDHTVGDMAAILDTCGVERAVLGGLSLGGFMSLAFNLRHPGRVRALMLFDTGPGYRSAEGRAGWNQTALARAAGFEERGLDAANRRQRLEHRSPEGLAKAARGMLAQFDGRVIESLPGIAVPTLVLVGANDQPFMAAADYMAAKIPGARKGVIAGAGHTINLDQPEAFNAAVEEFLASLA